MSIVGLSAIRAIVFATPTVRHYAPFVRVRRWAAQSVEYYPDHLGHGVAAYLDGIGFGQPSWSTGTGDLQASLVERVGDTWTVVDADTVASVNTATRTITLDNGFSLKLRDRDYYLVLSDQTAQSGAWPATVYGPMADDDLTIGHATTAAAPRAMVLSVKSLSDWPQPRWSKATTACPDACNATRVVSHMRQLVPHPWISNTGVLLPAWCSK